MSIERAAWLRVLFGIACFSSLTFLIQRRCFPIVVPFDWSVDIIFIMYWFASASPRSTSIEFDILTLLPMWYHHLEFMWLLRQPRFGLINSELKRIFVGLSSLYSRFQFKHHSIRAWKVNDYTFLFQPIYITWKLWRCNIPYRVEEYEEETTTNVVSML